MNSNIQPDHKANYLSWCRACIDGAARNSKLPTSFSSKMVRALVSQRVFLLTAPRHARARTTVPNATPGFFSALPPATCPEQFSLLCGLYQHLTAKQERNVLVLGLDNAGKTVRTDSRAPAPHTSINPALFWLASHALARPLNGPSTARQHRLPPLSHLNPLSPINPSFRRS